jgi:hypothetical protein
MDYLHFMASDLRGHLRRFATGPGISHVGRPMAHWRYYFRDGILHHRPNPAIRLQREDMRCHQALHRRAVLFHFVHASECNDGLQVLG